MKGMILVLACRLLRTEHTGRCLAEAIAQTQLLESIPGYVKVRFEYGVQRPKVQVLRSVGKTQISVMSTPNVSLQ